MRKLLITLTTFSFGLGLTAADPAEAPSPATIAPERAVVGPAQAPASQAEPGELQGLMTELQQLSQRIEVAQQQARESEEVQGALVNYARSLEQQMLEIDPDRESEIKRKGKLMIEIIKLEDPATMSPEAQQDIQEKVQEHQTLNTELAEIQEQALQTEDVLEKQEIARQAQIAKMQEVEPNLMQIVEERNELVRRIQSMHGQPQQPSPTTGS